MTAQAPATVFGDWRDETEVIPAPGKPASTRHPSMGTFKQAVAWLMQMRALQAGGMTFAQADETLRAPRRAA
jgi:hypothetical protein